MLRRPRTSLHRPSVRRPRRGQVYGVLARLVPQVEQLAPQVEELLLEFEPHGGNRLVDMLARSLALSGNHLSHRIAEELARHYFRNALVEFAGRRARLVGE